MASWTAIVDLLTQGKSGRTRLELLAVAGVAASIIADQAPADAPIVVTCDGPRTRIYCLYGDDAVDGSGANEDPLGFDPLNGDWRLSLPCPADDLIWVQAALNRYSRRITARDQGEQVINDKSATRTKGKPLVLNQKEFLRS